MYDWNTDENTNRFLKVLWSIIIRIDDHKDWDDAKKNLTIENYAESNGQTKLGLTFEEFCIEVEENDDILSLLYFPYW